ncbi:DUF2971 domain-containing protein [Pseudomonas amygdali]|uniref:DUF2971 domain-containing protein n=1 Tax=Pseudomonas amygdali TaxID=47877 RepID=UPI0005C7CA10|nr:DUF2971 domain-containing protein [Pseudomonas amygdali]KIY16890.1 hypothetical protein RD00_18195 [Pseudomonas amygdali pv. tabaci]
MEKNILYRFRPLDRLIGDEQKPGELENLEIFFASPEQLNDPLEGYKDIVWSGDEVMWRNLYRHYIICAIQHCFIFIIANEKDEVHREILIHNYADSLPPKLETLANSIIDEILDTTEVNSFIKTITNFKRPIRAPELTIHVRMAHRFILAVIFDHLDKAGACPVQTSHAFTKDKKAHLDVVGKLAQLLAESNNAETQAEIISHVSLELNEARILATHQGLPQQLFFLTVDLPDEYCKALENLTYPLWYTACFMSQCTNSSLWGTYGDNHRGACLKYTTEGDENRQFLTLHGAVGFSGKGIMKGHGSHLFHKIDYERSFVEIDFFTSLGGLPLSVLEKHWYSDKTIGKSKYSSSNMESEWRDNYWKNFIASITVKLREWRFESEYRLILAPSILDLSASKDRIMNYNFLSLEGIIFGIKTSLDDKVKIIKIIEDLCTKHNRADFNFYQAWYDPSTRKIQHSKLGITINISDFKAE